MYLGLVLWILPNPNTLREGKMVNKQITFCTMLLVVLACLTIPGQTQTWDYWGQVALYPDSTGINDVAVMLHLFENHTITATYYDTTHTDSALAELHGYSSPDGMFSFEEIPRDDVMVEIVLPECYELAVDTTQPPPWNLNPRIVCTTFQVDFFLTPEDPCYQPRTIGFWKHQATVAVTGRGHAQIDPDTLQDLFDEIFAQFDTAQYFPIEGVSSVNGAPLTAADALVTFRLPNNEMINKAKKQLLALLLNVEMNYVWLDYVCSEDSQTVEEAIAFVADMITNNGNELATAKDVADYINNEWEVPAGWIPDGYEGVNYGGETSGGEAQPMMPAAAIPRAGLLAHAYPNPFNPSTEISLQVPNAGWISVDIYDISGRQVTTLVNGWRDAGSHVVTFDGSSLTSGVFLYRIQAGDLRATGKMLLIK